VIDSGTNSGGIASSVVLLELATGCEAASDTAAWEGRDDLEVYLRGGMATTGIGMAMVNACDREG
jgi:hypothetical protein